MTLKSFLDTEAMGRAIQHEIHNAVRTKLDSIDFDSKIETAIETRMTVDVDLVHEAQTVIESKVGDLDLDSELQKSINSAVQNYIESSSPLIPRSTVEKMIKDHIISYDKKCADDIRAITRKDKPADCVSTIFIKCRPDQDEVIRTWINGYNSTYSDKPIQISDARSI